MPTVCAIILLAVMGMCSPVDHLESKNNQIGTMGEVTFEELRELLQKSTIPSFYLIDVRNPGELKSDGTIKNTTLNMPLPSFQQDLGLSDDDFMEVYGIAKPPQDSELVFTCRSGRRAKLAANIALEMGFSNVKVYSGSLLEWKAKKGPLEELE